MLNLNEEQEELLKIIVDRFKAGGNIMDFGRTVEYDNLIPSIMPWDGLTDDPRLSNTDVNILMGLVYLTNANLGNPIKIDFEVLIWNYRKSEYTIKKSLRKLHKLGYIKRDKKWIVTVDKGNILKVSEPYYEIYKNRLREYVQKNKEEVIRLVNNTIENYKMVGEELILEENRTSFGSHLALMLKYAKS